MKPVTTRRIIRPSTSTTPPAATQVQPVRNTPSSAFPAMEAQKSSLWSFWLERLARLEQASSTIIAHNLQRIRTMPRQADLAEARRLQDHLLAPWSDLQSTFDAASADGVGAELRTAYHTYIDLRCAVIRAMIRRCLVPSDSAVAQLDEAASKLQAFVDARHLPG